MQSRYLLCLCLALLSVTPFAAAQNTPTTETAPSGSATVINTPAEIYNPGDVNFIRSYVPQVPIADAATIVALSPGAQVRQATAYKDGFNRTFQTVQQQVSLVSGQPKHLVQVYDLTPRADRYSFLPYTTGGGGWLQGNAFQAQRDYYASKYPDEGYTAYTRSANTSTSGERSATTYAPGKSQVGQSRGTISRKISNNAGEVRLWSLDANGLPVSTGWYAANELFGEEVQAPGPGGVMSTASPGARIYTDRDGRIVLKMVADSNYNYTEGGVQKNKIVYQSTYYVYNELGQLRYVLSPRAVQQIESNSWVVTSDVLSELCFAYRYDKRGRKVAQKVPGKGEELYVYDKLGRVAFYQDSLLRKDSKWMFSIYDAQSRPVCTGLYQGAEMQATLQGYFYDGITYAPSSVLCYQKNYKLIFNYSLAAAGCEVLSYTYYDNYNYSDPGGTLWNTYATNGLLSSELQGSPGAETPGRSERIQGMVTGTMVKIQASPSGLASNNGEWRQSAVYYDDKGRAIYAVSRDLYQNNPIHYDYSSSQYDFGGRLLISKHVHGNINDATGTTAHTEWTKSYYDPATFQLVNSKHKVDNGAWIVLNSFTYDDMGLVKRKTLGNNGEVQDFSYNIRGQLTGINALYAETGNKESLSRTFGESLKYDYGFSQPRHDGRIAGIIWRGSSADASMGGPIPSSRSHAYGYDYEQSGRLKRADYRTQTQAGGVVLQSWNNSSLDYSVSNLFYDKNGNMRSMTQRGVQPGTGPVNMDVLSYRYANSEKSNQLLAVTDAGVADYGAGDFQDGNAGSTDDYNYDGNGNLKKDLNKGIAAISYTYLNKPSVIRYANNNSIAYSYDVAGGKTEELVRIVGQPDKRTSYQGNFVYRNDSLQYILTAEGRTIVYPQVDSPAKEEYFVKDHLGNVRSTIDVITYWTRRYLATYEVASANLEGLIFDNLNEIRDNKPGSTDPNDASSGRLNGAEPDHRVGTSLLVKVMAGDKVDLKVNNYYEDNYNGNDDTPVSPQDMLAAIAGTLTGGTGGLGTSESHNVKMVDRLFTQGNYDAYQDLLNSNTDPSKPKAFLNYVFFDENMKIITQASGAFQANGTGSWAEIGTGTPMVMPANGYLAVYLSNSSNVVACPNCGNTFFDLLKVEVSKGNLLEENHYYPHGLPIAGLSSTTATDFKEQRRRYQGNEYIKDLGLNWMDFHARQYDPQIGRFLNIDPLADNGGQEIYSSYAAMGNMPESVVDPNGEFGETFAQSNNSMGAEGGMASGGIGWLFSGKNDGNVNGLAWERGGGSLIGQAASQTQISYVEKMNRRAFWQTVMRSPNGTTYTATCSGVFVGASQLTPGSGGIGSGEGLIPPDATLVEDDLVSNNVIISTYNSPSVGTVTVAEEQPFAEISFIPHHVDDFDGFWGKISWVFNSTVGRGKYDWNGNFEGVAPIGGIAPLAGGINPGQFANGLKLTKDVVYSIETIENFYVRGSTIISGTQYTRNIQSLASLEGSASIPQLLNVFETEAKIQGASRIVLNGVDIYNKQLFNAQMASRFGYSFEQMSSTSIRLMKGIKP